MSAGASAFRSINVLMESARVPFFCGRMISFGNFCPPAATEMAARRLRTAKSVVAEKCSISSSPTIGPITIARFVERAK